MRSLDAQENTSTSKIEPPFSMESGTSKTFTVSKTPEQAISPVAPQRSVLNEVVQNPECPSQDDDVLGEMRDVRLDRPRSNTLGYRLGGRREGWSGGPAAAAFGRLSSAFNKSKDQLTKEEKAAIKDKKAAEKAAARAEKKEKKQSDKNDRGRKSKSPGSSALSDGETTPTSFFSRERIVGGRFTSGFRSPPAKTDYTVSLPPLGTATTSAQHRSIFSINWNQGQSTLPPRSPNRLSGPQTATSYISRGLGRFQLKRRNTSTIPGPQDTDTRKSASGLNPPTTSNFQNPSSLLGRHSVDPDRRRAVNRDRSLEDYSFGNHNTALIHRAYGDSPNYRSVAGLASSESSIYDRIDIEDLGADETQLFVKVFRYYHCYDLIPLSAKLVVFDSQLLVKKAFFALVSNGVRAAPLWDSAQQAFVGMLTITDFIHILRKYYKSSLVRMDDLEEHKIDTWRTVLTDMQRPLVSIGPDASLCDAITALINSKVHRLPVIDPQTGNVLYVLTHKRILRFLFIHIYNLPHASYLDKSIKELNVGTFEKIAVISPSTSLITALNMFIERRVSALPVVDDESKVVDIYAKFDVINLAAEKTYNNLDMNVGKALEFRDPYFEGVMTCRADDSLLQVMEKIVKAEVHRLVVADSEGHVEGVVSLSDILTFLVLSPLGIERPASRQYFSRTTSTDRENGTVEEEPELEATANVLGESAVEHEREKQRQDSFDNQLPAAERRSSESNDPPIGVEAPGTPKSASDENENQSESGDEP